MRILGLSQSEITMDKKSNYFDNIVIGTSPLMLLVAINIAKKGNSVLVIDFQI